MGAAGKNKDQHQTLNKEDEKLRTVTESALMNECTLISGTVI